MLLVEDAEAIDTASLQVVDQLVQSLAQPARPTPFAFS